MARPKKDIDLEQLRKCAERQWTNSEIAAFFRVDRTTIERRFSAVIEEARHSGCAKLRDLQWKKAEHGSDRMLIHMSEHYLRQHQNMKIDLSKIPDEVLVPEIERRVKDGKK